MEGWGVSAPPLTEAEEGLLGAILCRPEGLQFAKQAGNVLDLLSPVARLIWLAMCEVDANPDDFSDPNHRPAQFEFPGGFNVVRALDYLTDVAIAMKDNVGIYREVNGPELLMRLQGDAMPDISDFHLAAFLDELRRSHLNPKEQP